MNYLSNSIWNWKLSICMSEYLIYCAAFTIFLRVVSCWFRAHAVIRGDFPNSDTEPGTDLLFWEAFKECFYGFRRSKAHADFWTNAMLGFAELFAYPILLKLDDVAILGGWLAIRTAFSWSGWSVSRTSFNRFLLINVAEIAIAYFWLSQFIQIKDAILT